MADSKGKLPTYRSGGKTGSKSSNKAADKPRSGTAGKDGKPGGSGGKAADPYAAAQAKQDAQERKAKKSASERYSDQAARMEAQGKAISIALGKKGYKRSRDRKLSDITQAQKQADTILVEGFKSRLGVLKDNDESNDAAHADTTMSNVLNRAREASNALSETAAQGAGESDTLRSLNASLRNFTNNQSENNRSFFDTLNSINGGIVDLNIDTKTARVNNVVEANADRAQVWSTYFNQKSEALTNRGNVLGQAAEYRGLANEQVESKKQQKKEDKLARQSASDFEASARTTGQSWNNPGVSKSLMNWKGAKKFEAERNFAPTSAGRAQRKMTGPEGATLRKWE